MFYFQKDNDYWSILKNNKKKLHIFLIKMCFSKKKYVWNGTPYILNTICKLSKTINGIGVLFIMASISHAFGELV